MALGSPEGHGSSLDAFIDSIIYGGMNRIEPPLLIIIRDLHVAPPDVKDAVRSLGQSLAVERRDLRDRTGKDVEAELLIEA